MKMYCQLWGPCSAPTVQDLGKRFEYFSQKLPLWKFSPGVSQLIKMTPSVLQNTVSIVFGWLWYALLLLAFQRLICTIFTDDRSAGESTIHDLSRYCGGRFSVGFQTPGATNLRN
jgi:hypothetical protein